MVRLLVVSIVLLGSLAIDAKPQWEWKSGWADYAAFSLSESGEPKQQAELPSTQENYGASQWTPTHVIQPPNFAAAPYVRLAGRPHIQIPYVPHMPLHQVYVPHMFTQMGALPAVFCINAPKPETKKKAKTTEKIGGVKNVKGVKDVKENAKKNVPIVNKPQPAAPIAKHQDQVAAPDNSL